MGSRPPRKGNRKGSSPRGGPWYIDGLLFECQQCGQCCGGEPGYIWMTREEIIAAAKAMGMDVMDFCSTYVVELDRGFSLRELDGGDCSMLRRGRCAIYGVRPLQCRTWPWWPSNLATGASWREASRRCPGIGKGRRWSLSEIAAERDRLNI